MADSALTPDEKRRLAWVRFVATKFEASADGWVYTRDLGDLEHMRFTSDHTGYNAWWRRLRRAFDWKHLTGRDSLSKALRGRGARRDSLRQRLLSAWYWIVVCLGKDDNRPDGRIANAAIWTAWEEDGEYIAMMGPTVGVRVLDFLEAEPDHPHARLILDEMARVESLSWPKKEEP